MSQVSILKILWKGKNLIVLITSIFFSISLLYMSIQEESWMAKHTVSKPDTIPGDEFSQFKNEILEFKFLVYNEFFDTKNEFDARYAFEKFTSAFQELDSRGIYKVHNYCDMFKLFYSGDLYRYLAKDELNILFEKGGLEKLVESNFASHFSRLCDLYNLANTSYVFSFFLDKFNSESVKSIYYDEKLSPSDKENMSKSDFIASIRAERVDRTNNEKYYLIFEFSDAGRSKSILDDYARYVNDTVGHELPNVMDNIRKVHISESKAKGNQIQNTIETEKLDVNTQLKLKLENIESKLAYLNKVEFKAIDFEFYKKADLYKVNSSTKVSYGWLLVFVNTLLGFLLGVSMALFNVRDKH